MLQRRPLGQAGLGGRPPAPDNGMLGSDTGQPPAIDTSTPRYLAAAGGGPGMGGPEMPSVGGEAGMGMGESPMLMQLLQLLQGRR